MYVCILVFIKTKNTYAYFYTLFNNQLLFKFKIKCTEIKLNILLYI